ncbi:hybrid sensor histidine kinase/response regulator [Methanospirillum lacunae]|uniref:Hybrid sensor histidine kinase/response regulator n=1 Tax=Methanospirillum lacunae TaxID=668570 RepID=A0A2V2MT71_9EURY|nr:hybrid sensor histidine kinase/response regulator [Methanospirillum lacunae]PWR71394.1 hybrid sensor histidine kinase/response regulator [Methanospirillum lacunae]
MPRTSTQKILVVEDNRTQAESLRYILEKGGHEVIIAADGQEGLASIEKQHPDIVLTDVIMSPMDGYELCRRIKENPATRSIPVILVTYLYNPADVIKALEYGADNFIIKPYDADWIYSRIIGTLESVTQVQKEVVTDPLTVSFSNHKYEIRSGKMQILNILLSTYETAIKNNCELQVADERLHYLNAQLQKAVSDLKQANEELHNKNIERGRLETALVRSNKKFQYMGSIIHHILLTQLSSIYHNMEKASFGQKEGLVEPGYFKKAYGMVEKALNIVRITCETLDPVVQSPAWIDLRDLIHNALREIPAGLVRVDCRIPESVKVNAYPLIEKVFAELIDNSVRHGKKTTTIRFSIENHEDVPVLIYEDDGVGIPVQDKKEIFSHEYGLSASHGLFLSEEILSVTGITISETGVPGEGVRFEIQFPRGSIRIGSDTA